jgi:DNA repair photolyase
MKRFSGHKENWGEFVDAKINATILLEKEIKIKRPGKLWISGVCDPYKPIEAEKLTRRCLEILVNNN